MLKPSIFRSKFNRTFLIYFVSYFLVIIIPIIVIGSFSYLVSINALENELSNSSSNSLIQIRTSIENTLDEIDKLSIQTGIDARIYAYGNNTDSNYFLTELLDLTRDIPSKNRNIQSIKMYFKSNNMVISSSGILSAYKGEIANRWVENSGNTSRKAIWMPTQSIPNYDGDIDKVITLVRSVPVNTEKKLGLLAVNIHESKLSQAMENMKINSHSAIYITDGDKNMISGKPLNPDNSSDRNSEYINRIISSGNQGHFIAGINKTPTLVCYAKSSYTGWIFVSETPLTYLTQKLSFIQNLTFGLCLLLALVGIFISYLLSRTMYNPIKKLMDMFKSQPDSSNTMFEAKSRDSFTFLSGAFQQVIVRNKDLEKSYYSSLPVLNERFVLSLLNNKIVDPSEIQSQIDFLDIDFMYPNYCVVLIEVDNFAELADKLTLADLNLYIFAIRNIAEELLGTAFKFLSAEVSESRLAFIINIPEESVNTFNSDITGILEQIKESVSKFYTLTVSAGIGNIYHDIADCGLSYRESLNVMKYKLMSGTDTILFYHDLSDSYKIAYYYPEKTETLIKNNIKSGNIQKIKEYLDEIYSNIKSNYSVSYEEVYSTYNRLLDASLSVLSDSGIQHSDIFGENYIVYKDLAKKETLDEIHIFICKLFESVVSYISSIDKGDKNIEKAMDFIGKNFQRDLSVESIADYVGLNASYFSRVFKNVTGKTVLEFITLKRLESSKELLKETNLNIAQIAQKVGYNNVHSYMRFFKKYEGITPGDYRNKLTN